MERTALEDKVERLLLSQMSIGMKGVCKGCGEEVEVEDFYTSFSNDPIHVVQRQDHSYYCSAEGGCSYNCPEVYLEPCGPIFPLGTRFK